MRYLKIKFGDGLWYCQLYAINSTKIKKSSVEDSFSKIDEVTADNFPALMVEIGNKNWIELLKKITP